MSTRKISINPHILSLKESATLRVNQMAKSLRAQGESVYHFGFGQSPFPVHPMIVKALQQHAHEKDYLPTLGLLELREAIASYYKQHFNYDFSANRILVGPGSKELIFQCLFVLEGPVIIPAPSWVSYGPQVNVRGKHIVRAVTQRENNFKLTGEELQSVCDTLPEKEQKVLIVNSPNNPTGQVYSDQEIEDVVRVCRRENVLVISDEIYALIDFSGEKKKGFSHHYPEGTIVTAGLSKSHSAGGYRMGFLATPEGMEDVILALSSLVSETFSAVSAPIQHAARVAYSESKDLDDYLRVCCKIHEMSGLYIAQRLQKMDLDCPDPQGAFYVFPDFKNYKEVLAEKFNVTSSIELTDLLLEETRVALLPGTDFYMPPRSLTARMATVDYDGEELYKLASKVDQIDKSFIEKNCPHITQGLDSLESFLSKIKP